MALSLARLFSSRLNLSRTILRPNVNSWVLPAATKKTVAEELGLPPPPKRPASAYLRWLSEFRDKYQVQYPKLTFMELNKKLAETWNEYTPQQKERWVSLYRHEKEGFDRKYEKYMNSLTPMQVESINKLKKKRLEDKHKRQVKRDKKKDSEELGKPKHPGNAFTLYLVTLDRGGATLKEFLHGAATRWKQLPESDLKYYKDKAAKAREQYQKELHEWELKMIRAGRSDLVRQHQQLEDLKRIPKHNFKFPDE
ncbi:transcription factor A, mitochondrial-like [Macrobrachium nipponense]|uniref:transcription factor A, mitochondrial-like n=1 Tax=Macrobrachium nipponense TaxID=159736 RepID=UPI0030C875BE